MIISRSLHDTNELTKKKEKKKKREKKKKKERKRLTDLENEFMIAGRRMRGKG